MDTTAKITAPNTYNYLQVMPGIFSSKDMVICKPLVSKEAEKVNSIASLMNKVENLEPLEVLFCTEDNLYWTGDSVYLRAESYDHPSLKKIYYINSMPFVLIDKSMVIASSHLPRTQLPSAPAFPLYAETHPQPISPYYTVTNVDGGPGPSQR